MSFQPSEQALQELIVTLRESTNPSQIVQQQTQEVSLRVIVCRFVPQQLTRIPPIHFALCDFGRLPSLHSVWNTLQTTCLDILPTWLTFLFNALMKTTRHGQWPG